MDFGVSSLMILKAIGLFAIAYLSLASVASSFQERKIWANPKLPSMSLFGFVKVFFFNLAWMGICLVGSLLCPLYSLLSLSFNSRYFAHCVVERFVAQTILKLFVGPVEIRGSENLPAENADSVAPVYIANHDSQIDIAAVYYLNRPWRWIAKSSVIFLPGVGQIMWFSGHVFIDRVKKNNKSSTGARNLYTQSNKSVQEGVPMFFFPQGTRRLGERLPFKAGAFKIAKENNTLLIPVSIEIPLTAWNSRYPFGKSNPVVLTVHKPIETRDREIEDLTKESFDTIYSVLPDYTKET